MSNLIDVTELLQDDEALGDLVDSIRAGRIAEGRNPDTGEPRPAHLTKVMEHDYPILAAFHEKHAIPSLQRPSCLVCGKVPEQWPPAIRHMELPNIIVCFPCRDAVTR